MCCVVHIDELIGPLWLLLQYEFYLCLSSWMVASLKLTGIGSNMKRRLFLFFVFFVFLLNFLVGSQGSGGDINI